MNLLRFFTQKEPTGDQKLAVYRQKELEWSRILVPHYRFSNEWSRTLVPCYGRLGSMNHRQGYSILCRVGRKRGRGSKVIMFTRGRDYAKKYTRLQNVERVKYKLSLTNKHKRV